MRYLFLVFPVAAMLPAAALAGDKPSVFQWSASAFGSSSTIINDMVSRKPQYGFDLSGQRGAVSLNARIATVDSGVGADSQDQFTAAYTQSLKPFSLRYEVQYRAYPGTKAGYTDSGVDYQMTLSRAFKGVNYSLGAEYSDADYSNVRKSYGLNASISHGFMPRLSGWISVSHHHQWGTASFTNTNIGLYYQLTSKIGVSTSVNNWHAYASWNVDRPTLSISLSRKL